MYFSFQFQVNNGEREETKMYLFCIFSATYTNQISSLTENLFVFSITKLKKIWLLLFGYFFMNFQRSQTPDFIQGIDLSSSFILFSEKAGTTTLQTIRINASVSSFPLGPTLGPLWDLPKCLFKSYQIPKGLGQRNLDKSPAPWVQH